MSDPIATFQGLGTGIQTRDLVDQIIASESRPLLVNQARISREEARKLIWNDFRGQVQTLLNTSETLSGLSGLRSFTTSVGNESAASVVAGEGASIGSFSLGVSQLATFEKLGSDSFSDPTRSLGLSGEVVINGRAITLSADQNLNSIANSINSSNIGAGASRVGASVVGSATDGYRLILTSDDSGEGGIRLSDGPGGALQALGLLGSTTSLASRTSDGARSAAFTSELATIAGLSGFSASPAGTVSIGGLSVDIDLENDSLTDIAEAINAAASGAGSGVTAQVVQELDAGGSPMFRLDISGTTAFTDSNNVLETLGVLERDRGSIAQTVRGNAFTDGNAFSPASGSTLLTSLWAGGASEGVQAGDTIDLQGTLGDGTTFSTSYTVTGSDTYQDLVDALNTELSAGGRTATATIDADGSLLVTDDTAGASQLSLSIFTNNEGGGTLDFGEFGIETRGRDRTLVEGRDAVFTVDGQTFTRSRNTVSDVVQGTTLTLTGTTVTDTNVTVTRDLDAAADAVGEMVDAMNAIQTFVNEQFQGSEGSGRQPLSGDGVLRTMRSQLKVAFETTLSGALGDINRLGAVGVEIQRDGTYAFDRGAFTSALRSDPRAVERLFGVTGVGSTASVQYLTSTTATQVGTYQVAVTQAASQASTSSVGFVGYTDDGAADTLSVTDANTGSVYEVELRNGDGISDIVDRLNEEFATSSSRQLQAPDALFADALGTPATRATLLQDLFSSGGSPLGVADGDVLTISGTDDNGDSILAEFSVTDVATQTLGDLESAIEAALGSDVDVSFDGGRLTATSLVAERRSFSLSVTSDNAGGGSFSLGSLGEVEAGRGAARLEALNVAGELVIRATEFGSVEGFDVAYTAGGSDGSASLGLAAGSYRGTDVEGTIGGIAAEGAGRTLTGPLDTDVSGLVISYGGADTGTVGEIDFSRGVASLLEQAADVLLGAEGIDGVTGRIDDRIDRFSDRIASIEDRLERRRNSLLERFSRLEETIAEANARGQFLLSQLGSLPSGGSGAPTG
jgi:flagellar hook-associated protein 2